MSNLKSPYLIGLTAAAAFGLIAAVAVAADSPKIEKRDVMIRIAPPAFADIDTNKDGAVSPAEFDAFHAAHEPPLAEGDLPPPPPGGKRMRILRMEGGDLDANKDGKVSFAEFSGPMKAHFDEMDANKDGVLDDSEQPKDRMFERRLRK
ncbi:MULTISPECIES: EF-hand domain-containing protein [Asticcacaulis]|uniref:EF-hand domain-containing protein n=1 Tax=Asticcacaulis TaxID=76890 RepID=UPI001AE8149C|nr:MULTISPECIES: EF-hand domain-containing protein [Asticcacaulis]MBP2157715.1 hypothetical protein [Asticcacaulis solisilvae]MDR6798760.1 hypothetical protein [Asticcacaulis sp. BE141]